MKEYLYKLNDMIEKEAKEMVERLGKGGSRLTEGSIEYIDKITHIMKSLSCIIAMEEEKDNGESQRGSYRGGSYRGSYDGGSYEGGTSGRRGRDRMGRYTSRSYAHDDSFYSGAADEMIELLEDAKECAEGEMKQKLQKLIREAKEM